MDTNALPPADPDEESATSSAEFAKALADYEHVKPPGVRDPAAIESPAPGTKVMARVVAISGDVALCDVGARSEASADLAPFRNDDGTLRIAIGDELEMFVIEAGESLVIASSLRADPGAGLGRLREAKASRIPVSGRVTGSNPGGLEVDLGGVRGFCPLSQIELSFCEDASVYNGRTLEFVVTAIEEGRSSAVLSRRQVLKSQQDAVAGQRLAALKPGEELDGTVRRLEPFGAFVDLGGFDGMVHVSEIRHERLAHPRDALKEGESVRVRVLRVEAGKDGRPRVALSIKAALPDPWGSLAQRFTPGTRVRGTVARVAEFGAFVTLAPGIDGLVHISEMSSQRIQRASDAARKGQEIEVIVLGVDSEKKRISLSMRAVQSADRALEEPANPPPPPAAKRREPARAGVPASAPPRGTPKSAPPEELTTMAIALRAAEARARAKREKPGS